MTDKKNSNYTISTNKKKLDVDLISRFLKNSYWSKGIPVEVVKKSIENSLCFGVYQCAKQVGFARVITDYSTFAYIADVFIVGEHRKRGLSKQMMTAILNHPDLQGLKRWLLSTKDAHGLYEKFGFKKPQHPDWNMEIANLNIYESK